MTDRRRFLGALAVGAATSTTQAGEPPPDAVAPVMELVRLRYGRFLTDAQRRAVEDEVRTNQRLAEFLHRLRLDGADEPATVFPADAEE